MLDLLLIIVVFLFCKVSYNRGLVVAIYKLFGGLISLVLALFLYPVIGKFLSMTTLATTITDFISGVLANLHIVEGVQSQAAAIRDALTFLPDPIVELIVQNNNYEVYSVLGVNNLLDYIAVYTTTLAINAISIVIAWIVAHIGLAILVGGVDLITKLPLLNAVNKLGGAVIGLVNAVLIIWFICLIVPFVIESPSLAALKSMWESSWIWQWFYHHNLILDYISSLTLK